MRRWAKQKDSLFVITGGVLRPGLGTIGSEEVAIPEAFYKVIVTADRESYRVIAFLIPNQPTSNSYFEYTLTVDALEAVSGIDFFPGLPDAQERQLEAADGADWWR